MVLFEKKNHRTKAGLNVVWVWSSSSNSLKRPHKPWFYLTGKTTASRIPVRAPVFNPNRTTLPKITAMQCASMLKTDLDCRSISTTEQVALARLGMGIMTTMMFVSVVSKTEFWPPVIAGSDCPPPFQHTPWFVVCWGLEWGISNIFSGESDGEYPSLREGSIKH